MKKSLLFLVLCAFSLTTFAQSKKVAHNQSKNEVFLNELTKARQFAPNGIIRCASTEYNNSKKANGRLATDEAFEKWLEPKIQEVKRLRAEGRLPSVITIPVVIHVIHNGDAVGSGENISNAQALSQIQVFNEDFGKLAGTPGDGAGVDTTIRFCLAQIDPNGNPTNGIDRQNLGIASFGGAAVENAKASTIWDPTKYLNCWTFRFGGDLSGILGYAQFPSGSGLAGMPGDGCNAAGDASTDGVVCSFDTWGSSSYASGSFSPPYDKGRTMTHEVGHMLGLRHIWGDGGCGVDDFCDDTPLSDAANYGCINTNSCTDSPVDFPDQVQNYMDYSDDTCMNMFTQDQADRMIACLLNSPRRDDLLVSTVCNPVAQPYIQFKRDVCELRPAKSVVEGNGCSYTEFTVKLNIDSAPSQDAVVTFAIDGSSEADANDVVIVTPSVTFNTGSTADKNLVFRVLNDAAVEPDEKLVITYTVNANGGNAVENPNGNKFSMTIINDDISTTGQRQVFYDGFESYPDFSIGNVGGWTMLDNDGKVTFTDDTYNFPNEGYTGTFIVFNPSQTTPSSLGTGYDAHSGSKGYYCYNAATATPINNDYIFTPQITLGTNSELRLWAQSLTNNYNGGERFRVLVSTTNTNPASFTLISPAPYTIPPLEWTQYTYDLSAYDNQTVYIAVHVVSQDEFVFMLDDFEVLSDLPATVETAVNTSTATQSPLVGSGSSVNYFDTVTSKIVNTVVVNDASNYGCTTSSVSRAGTGALQYGASTNAVDFAMSKQFTITPSNVVNGNTTITFFFTEAEIAGWETATGNTRSQLYVAKDGTSQEIQPVSIGSSGSDVTLTATFTTGVDGVYSFARQEVLGNQSFEITGLTLYPNPNNGSFNVQFAPTSKDVNVNVHDIRGRQIFNQSYQNNGLFNETLQLNNVQSGIYLVTIQDGARKVTKKIIVE